MFFGPFVHRLALIALFSGVLMSQCSLVVADDTAAPSETVSAGVHGWSLRMPPDAVVSYHGVASFDEAGVGTTGMIYPAFGVASLLVAMVTHGVIVDAAKQSQKERMQAEADQVLAPYRSSLDKYPLRDLLQTAIARAKVGAEAHLLEPGVDAGQSTVVESLPVFKLTQDQRAIVLDNLLAIQMPGVKPEAAYRTSIRIVSSPSNAADPAAVWLANDGESIKDESARLLAASFDIAFNDMTKAVPSGSPVYRTIRYMEGTIEKIERAQVLVEQCGRILIRTLRGNLMSVPLMRPTTAATPEPRCTTELSLR
jgi:hypothetical protein